MLHLYKNIKTIRRLPEEKTQKFITLTADEKVIVREYLYLKHYRFFIYCISIFFTGIRPEEIMSLRISDVNLISGIIHLKPFSNTVKNRRERRVVIHPKLLHFYVAMNLSQYPEHYFIFSDNFEPGEKQKHSRYATSLWNKLVIQELGINKYMYAMKHLGADSLIEAGASEQNVVDHMGHSDKFMTRRYTLKGIEKSREVIKNTLIDF